MIEYSDALAHHFRIINAEWIERMYRMEPVDRQVLEDPKRFIIDPGGAVLFVEADGLGIVGACALSRSAPGTYELTKMGVMERARGRKAGEFLLRAAIAKARDMDAKTLYLLTNAKSQAAIHLYEKVGFVHDAEIMQSWGSRYERCDVAMRYAG